MKLLLQSVANVQNKLKITICTFAFVFYWKSAKTWTGWYINLDSYFEREKKTLFSSDLFKGDFSRFINQIGSFIEGNEPFTWTLLSSHFNPDMNKKNHTM